MDDIKKFSRMARISMPDIFGAPPVTIEGLQESNSNLYRYDLLEALTLDQFRNIISRDDRIHVLYVYEPSTVVLGGKQVCAIFDIHLGVMCRIFAETNEDGQIRYVIVQTYTDLDDMTQSLRWETSRIREDREERVHECVTRMQLMALLL